MSPLPSADEPTEPEYVSALSQQLKVTTDDIAGFNSNRRGDGPEDRISTAICYNRKCDDYRVERDASKPCACKSQRVPIKGAGR